MTMDDYRTSPTIGNRLKFKRKSFGVNQGELSAISGVSQRQISSYERGKSEPRADTLERLASALGTTAEWLEFGDEESDLHILTEDSMRDSLAAPHVPILNWSIDSIRNRNTGFFQQVLPIPDVASDEAFALVVRGNSMAPEYPDGSVIVVDPNVPAASGDDVLAEIGGEPIFKRYSVELNDCQFLVPLNPQFPALAVDDESFRIWGVVVLQLIYRNKVAS